MKLECTVTMKKMSKIGKNGKLEWKMREVTSLACPAKLPSIPEFGVGAMMSQQLEPGGTNGKRQKLEDWNNDQPQHDRTSLIERKDT